MKTVYKKCYKCGAMVEVLKDCTCKNCGIVCCGEPMKEVKMNSVEAAIEKHLPQYEVVGQYVLAHVPHVMQEDHYIEFIALVGKQVNARKYFKPGDTPKAVFPYIKGSKIVASCNKHGLWQTDVK